MSLSQRISNAIWGRSGGRCYLDRSEILLRTESGNSPIGEIAHIVGERVLGPRGAHELIQEERNKVGNLILLCPNHHTEIDQYPEIWTVERLQKIKTEHERWVSDSLKDEKYYWSHKWDSFSSIVIDFEEANSKDEKFPAFTFSARNLSSDDIIIQSIYAKTLKLAPARAFTREEYDRLSVMMNITRMKLFFNISEVGEEQPVHPFRGFDSLETAMLLKPGEVSSFTARIFLGDYVMGTFLIAANFWEHPAHHEITLSTKIGFFSYPKDKSSKKNREACFLDFEQLALEAIKSPNRNRVEPGDDIFDQQQLLQGTIGRMATPRARAKIEEWLESDKPKLFIAALEALCSAPSSEWKSAMIERSLSSPTEKKRFHTIAVIETLKYTDAYESLALKSLNDSSLLVRNQALKRLNAEGSPVLEEVKIKLQEKIKE